MTEELDELRAEVGLYASYLTTAATAIPLYEAGDYLAYLKACSPLVEAINTFLDTVKVHADDAEVLARRLHLLVHVQSLVNRVACLVKLPMAGAPQP